MKRLNTIDQLHRRRLSTLEAALKHARAAQRQCELALEERRREEEVAHERGLQVRRAIDAVLFTGTVKQPEIQKAQQRLLAAKDALNATREAVEVAKAGVAAAIRCTEEAAQAWREQAATVEKFDTILTRAREERSADMLYREEIEQEDLYRRKA